MSTTATTATPSLASRMGTSGANFLRGGANLVGSGASMGASGFKSLLEHHKIHGVLFIFVTVILLIISIIDMAQATLVWDSAVTTEQARHRDTAISSFVFTLVLFFYMIFKEFNYMMPSSLRLA
jgi:hypothetical protein